MCVHMVVILVSLRVVVIEFMVEVAGVSVGVGVCIGGGGGRGLEHGCGCGSGSALGFGSDRFQRRHLVAGVAAGRSEVHHVGAVEVRGGGRGGG